MPLGIIGTAPAFLKKVLRALSLRRGVLDPALSKNPTPILLEIHHYRGQSVLDCNNDYISALVCTSGGRYAYLSFLRSRGDFIGTDFHAASGGLPVFAVRDVAHVLPTAQRSSSEQIVRALSFTHAPLPLWELVALVYSVHFKFPHYAHITDALNPYGALIPDHRGSGESIHAECASLNREPGQGPGHDDAQFVVF
ncbi:hypothetical protein HYPSUDRAFT_205621 [Hypholoma sublateritium FD-334 SS-4]|uniref:Uncharacterized protein n=1 Tax=Hypholoma sublateritium (strain FD-334 SS-4) TaxID=945553 RepID=A0A0D2NMZ2_HYPSF|nr:hypothetical protein HYPSUDRAFT_205621 [Hypholoma sublateritium FD-334 SS-4]